MSKFGSYDWMFRKCLSLTDEFVDWLDSIGYFDKPASIKYHGTENGDLFRHCAEVAEQLLYLTDRLGLKWERDESPLLVGLLHDVCKCDDYVFHRGKWCYNGKRLRGHGAKSVYMLNNHIELTKEETMCIQYHMGAFVEKDEWKLYSNAVHDYPNVLYTHTADMIASQILGI